MTALDDFARLSGKLFLDGALVSSKSTSTLDVIEPATEDRIGAIADATDGEVDQAIDLADIARRKWCAQDTRTRATTLHEVAAPLRRNKETYAECLTREEGKPF